MEDKLRAIVTRIEASVLTDEEKYRLYDTIAQELRMTAVPILLKYVPEEKVQALAADTSKVSVESMTTLIADTISDGKALEEMGAILDELLTELDQALSQGGVL